MRKKAVKQLATLSPSSCCTTFCLSFLLGAFFPNSTCPLHVWGARQHTALYASPTTPTAPQRASQSSGPAQRRSRRRPYSAQPKPRTPPHLRHVASRGIGSSPAWQGVGPSLGTHASEGSLKLFPGTLQPCHRSASAQQERRRWSGPLDLALGGTRKDLESSHFPLQGGRCGGSGRTAFRKAMLVQPPGTACPRTVPGLSISSSLYHHPHPAGEGGWVGANQASSLRGSQVGPPSARPTLRCSSAVPRASSRPCSPRLQTPCSPTGHLGSSWLPHPRPTLPHTTQGSSEQPTQHPGDQTLTGSW